MYKYTQFKEKNVTVQIFMPSDFEKKGYEIRYKMGRKTIKKERVHISVAPILSKDTMLLLDEAVTKTLKEIEDQCSLQ